MKKTTTSEGVLEGKHRTYHVKRQPAILSRHQQAIAEFPPKLSSEHEQDLLKDAVSSAFNDAFKALNVQWKANNPANSAHSGYSCDAIRFGNDLGGAGRYKLTLMAQNKSDFTALVERLTQAGIQCSAVEDIYFEYPSARKHELPAKFVKITTNDRWQEMIDIINTEFIEKIRPEARISSKDIETDFQQRREAKLKEMFDSTMEKAKGNARG